MRASQILGISLPVGFVVVVAALLASVYYIRSRRAHTTMNVELLAEVTVAKSRKSSPTFHHPTEEIEMGTTKQPAEIRRETIRAQARKEALNGRRQGA